MHRIDSCLNYKKEGGILGDWTYQGTLESGCKPSQPPSHGSNHISQCAPRIWAGRGTGTAALEANLIQQLMAMMETVLFEVFLDLNF